MRAFIDYLQSTFESVYDATSHMGDVVSCQIKLQHEYDYVYGCDTVKPVCSDHLSNKIYYLWFVQ